MECGKFPVQSYYTVLFRRFTTLCPVWTSFAVFAFVDFFLSSVLIPFYVPVIFENEFPSVRTNQVTFRIPSEVYCTVRIVTVCFTFRFFLKHGEFHVLFHVVFFTIQIVIIGTISCICHRIFRVVQPVLILSNLQRVRTQRRQFLRQGYQQQSHLLFERNRSISQQLH